MRTIGVVTVARSDYGIYLPVLRALEQDPALAFYLFVSGMHLSPEFGLTVRGIEADGFPIRDRIEMSLSSDSPEGVAKTMGLGTIGFAQAYARSRPDLLLVLGDRYEMQAAVLAALPFNIPIAHIHGGESTEGLIDEPIRHSITKMSHLHFVTTQHYAQRVIQMGEAPWRVVLSGAPSLDNLRSIQLWNRTELHERYGIDLAAPTLLVTFHPVTLGYEKTGAYARELLAALAEVDFNLLFTYPNADTHGRLIIELIREFVARHKRAQAVENLGTQGYFSVMSQAAAMVGNSSSGIVEAASFKLPVVNIGARQQGRVRGKNVIDVGPSKAEIIAGIRQATSEEFTASLADLKNPYGDGQAAERIVTRLKEVELNEQLLIKRFHHLQDA